MSAEDDLRALEAMLANPKPEVKPSLLARITSFARPRRPSNGKKSQEPALHRTAYLDGLRGFAALLVFSLHHQVWGHAGIGGEFILENAFGWDNKYSCSPVAILRWPSSSSSLVMSCLQRLWLSCNLAIQQGCPIICHLLCSGDGYGSISPLQGLHLHG
jgi:hypothetical protein